MMLIKGGKPAVSSPLRPYNSIGKNELDAAISVVRDGPLSGFLGGNRDGGRMVCQLEELMCDAFGVKHAVACNSGTSGLLIASMACGVTRNTPVSVPVMTMSATAAAPAFLGADIHFSDVNDKTFTQSKWLKSKSDVVITTNLFGHPAHVHDMMRDLAFVIEDNAQGWFARENNKYAGTIGHIGVFSGNFHKSLQCGEGGVCLTDNDDLAYKMAMARNHGELAMLDTVGLNLRMTEVEAAILCEQVKKHKTLVEKRIFQAESLTHMVKDIPGIYPPTIREGCTHVYYVWPILIDEAVLGMSRNQFVRAMKAEGVPLSEQYSVPLTRLPAFKKFARPCPVADALYDDTLCFFENCLYDPTKEQKVEIEAAFHKVGEYAQKNKQKRLAV